MPLILWWFIMQKQITWTVMLYIIILAMILMRFNKNGIIIWLLNSAYWRFCSLETAPSWLDINVVNLIFSSFQLAFV